METTSGVGHRRLHLAVELDLLLDRVGQSQEHAVQHAPGLAGADHGDIETVERLRVLGECGREARPALDVHAHLVRDLGQDLVVGLLREDVQRAQQRQTGVDHRCELSREDRDVLHLDLVAEPRDLQFLREVLAALLLDVDGHVAHRAQLAHDELRVLRFELTLDELAAAIANLVRKGFRHVLVSRS